MDEDTTKMIKERFDALPKMVQDAILSSDYENLLIEIGKKYQLNVDQMGMLEQETTLTMMGLTATKDFETELTRELNVDPAKGRQIVVDINEKIFFNIRELLKLMNTPIGKEPSVEEEPPMVKPDEKKEEEIMSGAGIEIMPEEITAPKKEENIEKPDDMLAKVENPELIAKEIENEKMLRSISAQKLSGSFQMPNTKTDYSLDNMSKSSKTPEIKKDTLQGGQAGVKIPLGTTIKSTPSAVTSTSPSFSIKVDPYREMPE